MRSCNGFSWFGFGVRTLENFKEGTQWDLEKGSTVPEKLILKSERNYWCPGCIKWQNPWKLTEWCQGFGGRVEAASWLAFLLGAVASTLTFYRRRCWAHLLHSDLLWLDGHFGPLPQILIDLMCLYLGDYVLCCHPWGTEPQPSWHTQRQPRNLAFTDKKRKCMCPPLRAAWAAWTWTVYIKVIPMPPLLPHINLSFRAFCVTTLFA